MKRIVSILFVLCLVAGLALSINAESTNKLTYTVGASASTVSANTEFTILVKVTENTGVCFVKAVVKYDSSVLTYVSGSKDTTVFTGATLDINNPKKGEVILSLGGISAFFSPNPTIYNKTGEFVTLKFKVNEDAPAGSTTISVTTDTGDVVITKDSIPNYDFEIKNASANVIVTSGAPHTCKGGAATKENEVAVCLLEIEEIYDNEYMLKTKEHTWQGQENALHYLGIIDSNRDPIFVFDSPQKFLDWLDKVTVKSQYNKFIGEEE